MINTTPNGSPLGLPPKKQRLKTYGLQYEEQLIFLPSTANLRACAFEKKIFYRLLFFITKYLKKIIFK
jgi:hypothetical protein